MKVHLTVWTLVSGAALLVGCAIQQSVPSTETAPAPDPSEPVEMPPYAKEASLRLLLAQARYDELEAALEQFRAATLWNIEHGEPRLIHAYKAFSEAKTDVREQIEEWIEARPKSYQAHTARAFCELEMALDARGGKWARETNAEQFRLMRRFMRSAEREARAALKLQPRNVAPYRILVFMARHASDRFGEMVTEALAAFPESATVRWQILVGLQPKWSGSFELMEKFAQSSQEYAARNPALKSLLGAPWWARGETLRGEKRFDEAIEMYTKALEFGEELDFLSARSVAARGARRYDLAIQDGKRAVALFPWVAEVPGNFLDEAVKSARRWATNQYHYGSWEEANKVSSLIVDLNPKDVGALALRGGALCQMKRTEAGVADLERAIAVSPDDETARQMMWGCYAAAGNVTEGLRRHEAYLQQAPGNGKAQYDAALMYLQRSDPVSAVLAYRVACVQEYQAACSREQDLLQQLRKNVPKLAAEFEGAWNPHPQERLATVEAYEAFMQDLEAGDFSGKPGRAAFVERPSPRFPAWAARETDTGSVTAHLYVRADGTVAGVKIVSAKPAGFFELAALRALLRWRLEPTGVGYKAAQRLDFTLPPKVPSVGAKKKGKA